MKNELRCIKMIGLEFCLVVRSLYIDAVGHMVNTSILPDLELSQIKKKKEKAILLSFLPGVVEKF